MTSLMASRVIKFNDFVYFKAEWYILKKASNCHALIIPLRTGNQKKSTKSIYAWVSPSNGEIWKFEPKLQKFQGHRVLVRFTDEQPASFNDKFRSHFNDSNQSQADLYRTFHRPRRRSQQLRLSLSLLCLSFFFAFNYRQAKLRR